MRDGLRVESDSVVMDNITNRVDPQDEVIRELRQRLELLEQHIEKLDEHLTHHERMSRTPPATDETYHSAEQCNR